MGKLSHRQVFVGLIAFASLSIATYSIFFNVSNLTEANNGETDNAENVTDDILSKDQSADKSPTKTSSEKVAEDVANAVIDQKNANSSNGLFNPKKSIEENLPELYQNLLPILFLLAFLMMIYSGYLYISSFGDEAKVKEAKEVFTAALTGLALMLLIPLIVESFKTGQPKTPAGTTSEASKENTPQSENTPSSNPAGEKKKEPGKTAAPAGGNPSGEVEAQTDVGPPGVEI
ncbi:hypothetical protein HYW32_04275 [Candidatus Berkelbacteria bacterium]|nr:hypothetical protein [Candidatus Berkelbacteria bacterium]